MDEILILIVTALQGYPNHLLGTLAILAIVSVVVIVCK